MRGNSQTTFSNQRALGAALGVPALAGGTSAAAGGFKYSGIPGASTPHRLKPGLRTSLRNLRVGK